MDSSQPPVDRHAIARQVIVSAGEVMVAAGFSREEIGQFFRQAAEQLAPNEPATQASSAEGGISPRLDAFHVAFQQSRPVLELQRLTAQARPLLPLDRDGPHLKACFDVAMQMIPLLAEAQAGLRTVAQEAGLPLHATRAEWMKSGNDCEPAIAGPAICLEDFEPAYSGAFEAVAAVLDELRRREDAEAFTYLLGHLAENGVVIDRGLRRAIENGMSLLPV